MEEWRSGEYTKKEMMSTTTSLKPLMTREKNKDNKTPAKVRIAVTGVKGETSEKIEKWDTFL